MLCISADEVPPVIVPFCQETLNAIPNPFANLVLSSGTIIAGELCPLFMNTKQRAMTGDQ